MAAQIAPRRLTREQQIAIGEALKAFAGKTVRLESYSLDAEAAILGKQIAAALNSAGIIIDDGLMSEVSGNSIALAVHITGDDKELVSALLTALSNAHIAVTPEPVFSGGVITRMRTGNIPTIAAPATLFVGIKPIVQ